MANQSLILGTAGHIDHGKSSLILALTGTDPDRLAEEKKRGITIELGFAQLSLPSGRKMGVVDVPGHERFVRQMVSGATGVDVALLVIAADDGVMPQTVEHIAVLELLGIESCVVALTKIDLVDEDWLEFIQDEVETRLAQTRFAGCPIVSCSSRTGVGLDELLTTLDAVAAKALHSKTALGMRMPIDRAFTIKGAGTVVTGTLWNGSVAPDDEVEILPAKITARVRSVQMHGKTVQCATSGNRVALNLTVGLDQVHPGDFLATPGTLEPTDRFDARLNYADPFHTGKPFATGTRVHVAHGTREVIGRVLLANGQEALGAGQSCLVQIRLDEPLALSLQDRFVIRSYSPVHVIGGGVVLTCHPRRRTTLTKADTDLLGALEQGDIQKALDAQLSAHTEPQTFTQINRATGIDLPLVEHTVDQMIINKQAVLIGSKGSYVAKPAALMRFTSKVEQQLIAFHAANPEATGIAKDTLRQEIAPTMDKACFDALLQEAEHASKVVQSQGEVSHVEAGAGAKALEREAAAKLLALLVADNTSPRPYEYLVKDAQLSTPLAAKAIRSLCEQGKAVRLDSDTYYAASVIAHLKTIVSEYLTVNGPAKATELKDAMGTSRRYAIPLLEYFDRQGFTKRDGDFRTL